MNNNTFKVNDIYLGDCLELMKCIHDKSIDMILCDLPYGTTKCKWDTVIPFESLWKQYNRIIKDNGAIVLFGQEPFSSKLRMSNLKMFKYDWYWLKSKPQGFLNAKKMPLKDVEIISVFYKKQPIYNPQGLIKSDLHIIRADSMLVKGNHLSAYNGGDLKQKEYTREYTNYPKQSLSFAIEGKPLHKTAKPTNLYEYLIKTYTNEGDLILDNACGSGTIGIAKTIGRNFIGIEKDKQIYSIACERIENLK